MKADFKNYALALFQGETLLFSSKDAMLKPLMQCIVRFKGKAKGCILHDKVVGLAAAKLIVDSGMISEVITPVCSEPAKEHLARNKIMLTAQKTVRNILNRDNTDLCPMEKMSLQYEKDSDFFIALKAKMNL